MMDYSEKYTEEAIAQLERKIYKEYAKAYAEISKKADDYFDKYDNERWAKEYAAFRNGKYTASQFKQWEIAQLARGEHWTRLRDDIANRLTHTNEIAAAYINGDIPRVFAENHNFALYEIEQGLKGAEAFEVINEEAVMRMMTGENHSEFRVNRINPKRDYAWNKERIDSAILSGILQGKGIKEMRDAFLGVMQNNRSAAMRNARTSMTSAQNGGHYTAYKKAEAKGINVLKEWVATHDERTRDSHATLDGEQRRQDDTFSNELLYPGDPKGKPAEVYNCRCRIKGVLPTTQRKRQTYAEWAAEEYPEWLERKNKEQK